MAKRLADCLISIIILLILSPLFLIAVVGIKLSSAGPVLYRAKRVGLNGCIFIMYKFRTMDSNETQLSSRITAKRDPRIYPFGLWLRRFKIDELPQLFNILKGEMSFVGPRPEDPDIVQQHYHSYYFETLRVLPGLASPGSIYNYTHGEKLIDVENTEDFYITQLLPTKLALDAVYVREASFLYDLKIVARTIWTIFCIMIGKQHFSDPPEMKKINDIIYYNKDKSGQI